MATIRKDLNPSGDIARNLDETLRKNGMEAHLRQQGDAYQLIVASHDSPVMTYNVSSKEAQRLMNGGTHASDKKAYDTFASLVKADFHIPLNFVSAKNTGSHVNMGLNGYRADIPTQAAGLRVARFPHSPAPSMATPPFEGYREHRGPLVAAAPAPARPLSLHQNIPFGMPLRRIDGRAVAATAPAVAERPGGELRPGELRSGGYGFYFRGDRQQLQADIMANIGNIESKPTRRPDGNAIPLSSRISSPVYFSQKEYQEVLASHGIVIDTQNKTLTIKAAEVPKDLRYRLTDEEAAKLSAEKADGKKGPTMEQRLEIINKIIAADFAGKVTKEMLESKNIIDIPLQADKEKEILGIQKSASSETKSVSLAELQQRQLAQERSMQLQQPSDLSGTLDKEHRIGAVDGRALAEIKDTKGWYREESHGREVSVGLITVEPDRQVSGKYRMTAVIDGQRVSHEISQKQYDKFLAVDDYHRMKLFSKVFPEVEMKGNGTGPNLGESILAALAAGTAVAHTITQPGMPMPSHPAPEIYIDTYESQKVFHKPGVVDAASVAAAQYEDVAARQPSQEGSMSLGR